jgi:hypothetical protein
VWATFLLVSCQLAGLDAGRVVQQDRRHKPGRRHVKLDSRPVLDQRTELRDTTR